MTPERTLGSPCLPPGDRGLSGPHFALALAALFLSSMCTMGDLVIGPAVAEVYRAFADSPSWLVNLGVTGPALVGLPFGLATGAACDHMDKKVIMVTGFAAFTVGAVFGAAVEDVRYFVSMRLLATGVGWGITNTAALSILAEMFEDDGDHGKYVGWYNAAISVIGAALAAVAGGLAVSAWKNVYFAYLAAIPVLIMLVAFLPRFPPHRSTAMHVETVRGKSTSSAAALARDLLRQQPRGSAPGWWRKLAPLTLQTFAVALLYFVMLYLISLYVTDADIGDESFTGMLTSVMTVSTALGSLVFGSAYRRLGNAVCLPALFAISSSFFALSYWPNAAMAPIAVAVAGLAWPFCFCYFYTHCTELVPAAKQSTATSVVASANGLAVTGCSYLLTGAIEMTGGSCLTVYPLFGAAMAGIATLSTVGFALSHRKTCPRTGSAA